MDKTVVKAFRLLETLAKEPEPIGITDLANRLSLTKSNVHRSLDTLKTLGYIEYLPENRKYRASFKLWEMGTRIADRLDVKQVAEPLLKQLGEETGETVHLCVLSGGDVVYIDKVDCKHHVRPVTRIGGHAPAHCVSTGKAMLAHQAQSVIDAVMDKLEAHTAQTITSKAEFAAELEKIRIEQIAYNRGEWHSETIGAASAIRNANGVVVAAVGVSIPTTRANLTSIRKLAPRIRKTAADISSVLGYRSASAE